jgi:anaerobic dimethyl sulfoxide reductase subunit C (anchor subunit)
MSLIPEGPLVVFTLASELACGLALAAACLDLISRGPGEAGARRLGISVFPVAVLGMAASLFHLGRPLSAWRAILNWRTSPLSAEILSFGLFLGASFLYSILWWARRTAGRRFLGVVTGFLGLGAVISSSLVYLIPGRAPWNSGWVLLSFLGSTFVLGGMAAHVFGKLGEDIRASRIVLSAGAVGGAAILVSTAWMLARFSGRVPDAYGTSQLEAAGRLVLSDSAVWLGLYVGLAGILPVAFAILRRRSSRPAARIGRMAFWSVLAGAAVGRVLMFAVGIRIPLF